MITTYGHRCVSRPCQCYWIYPRRPGYLTMLLIGLAVFIKGTAYGLWLFVTSVLRGHALAAQTIWNWFWTRQEPLLAVLIACAPLFSGVGALLLLKWLLI